MDPYLFLLGLALGAYVTCRYLAPDWVADNMEIDSEPPTWMAKGLPPGSVVVAVGVRPGLLRRRCVYGFVDSLVVPGGE